MMLAASQFISTLPIMQFNHDVRDQPFIGQRMKQGDSQSDTEQVLILKSNGNSPQRHL